MTDVVDARKAIVDRWNTLWASETPTWYDNEKVKTDVAEWARLTIRHEVGAQDSLGPPAARKYVYGGRIFVQLFVARDAGGARLAVLQQQAIDVFIGARFDGVWVTRAIPRELGEDGKWSLARVEFEFSYEQTR